MELFGIGPLEFILILILALIVLGPERLPEVARQITKTVRDLRRMSEELSKELGQFSLEDLEASAGAETNEAEAAPAETIAPPEATSSLPAPAVAEAIPAAATADVPELNLRPVSHGEAAEPAPSPVTEAPAPTEETPLPSAPPLEASTEPVVSSETAPSAEVGQEGADAKPAPAEAVEPGAEPIPPAEPVVLDGAPSPEPTLAPSDGPSGPADEAEQPRGTRRRRARRRKSDVPADEAERPQEESIPLSAPGADGSQG